MKKRFFILTISIIALCFAFIFNCSIGDRAVVAKSEQSFSVNAKSAYMVDFDTNTVLYELNENQRLPIASMVKIMTSLLAFEAVEKGNLSYDEQIVISAESAGMGGSQIFLDANSKHLVSDLLKSIVVASANDSCVAIAERLAGSELGFVNLMNKRAKELNMTNTLFANSTGLPAPNHYSSAKDVTIMLRELLNHKKYYEFCNIWLEDYVHPDGRTTVMTNTNRLIRFYKGCDSGKTGFTSESMFCLSASAKRNDMRVISTVIGSPDSKTRFSAVSNMFNYAFGSYENKVIYNTDDAIENNVEVLKGKKSSIEIVPERRVTAFTKRNDESKINAKIELPDTIKAPIRKGDKVGKVVVIKDNVVVDEINLIANESVDRARIIDFIKKIKESW